MFVSLISIQSPYTLRVTAFARVRPVWSGCVGS